MYLLHTAELIYKHAFPDNFWRWTEITNIYYCVLLISVAHTSIQSRQMTYLVLF